MSTQKAKVGEKARLAAREKPAEEKKEEAKKMLDQLIAEQKLKAAGFAGGKTTSAAAKARAQSVAKASSSAHRDHAKEQSKQTTSSTAGSVSLAKSDAPAPATAKASSSSSSKGRNVVDASFPKPAAEPNLDGGATAGVLTFKTASATDVKHKRGRKAFKKSAEEATRLRGLTVQSVKWLEDRAGVRVRWSRPAEEDEDEIEDEDEDEEQENEDEGEVDVDYSSVADGETQAAMQPAGPEVINASEDASEDAFEVDANNDAATPKPDDGIEAEDADEDAEAGQNEPRVTQQAERSTVAAFTPADFNALFERDDKVVTSSDKAWSHVAFDVLLLLHVVEERFEDDDEKKARVREHLDAISTLVDIVGAKAEVDELEDGGFEVEGKGQLKTDDGQNDDAVEDQDEGIFAVVEGSSD